MKARSLSSLTRRQMPIAMTQAWMTSSAIPVSYRNKLAIPAIAPAANVRRLERVHVKIGITSAVLIKLKRDTGITAAAAVPRYSPKSQTSVTRDVMAAIDLRRYDEATV